MFKRLNFFFAFYTRINKRFKIPQFFSSMHFQLIHDLKNLQKRN